MAYTIEAVLVAQWNCAAEARFRSTRKMCRLRSAPLVPVTWLVPRRPRGLRLGALVHASRLATLFLSKTRAK